MATRNRIDRYVPEEILGRAGLVDTFRVRVQDESLSAVLKVVFLDRAPGPTSRQFAQRFLATAQLSRASGLQAVAKVIDLSDDLDAAYVATEMISGVDLEQCLAVAPRSARHGPGLAPTLAGLLCAEVARVLTRAHGAATPLFHLGLAPGNVRVTEDGRVVVLDFGLTALQRGLDVCPLDKWRFVAPELVGIDSETLTSAARLAADVYSVGRLLHFLLTGTLPARASTLADVAKLASRALTMPANVPSNVISALRALTSPDPSDRPSSMEDVVAWLSGGIASAEEAQSVIAAGLRSTGAAKPTRRGHATGKRASSPAPPSQVAEAMAPARPPQSLEPPTPERPVTPVRPVGGTALATTRASLPWLRGVLAMVLVGLALAGWGVLAKRTQRSSDHAVGIDAGTDDESVLSAAQATPWDGGAVVHDPELPSIEMVQAQGFEGTPTRTPNHLYFDTNPGQADVWVDGVLRGRTPVDLTLGPGGHRVVAIKQGYLMIRAVYDTTHGEYARRELQRAGMPHFGDAILDVQCATPGKFPIVLDDEETGLLCPVPRLHVTSGKHSVGIYVPARRANVAVEVQAVRGRTPTRVTLSD